MAKFNIYAVGYGLDPVSKEPVFGIKCQTWNDCQQYVKGVEGAKFKGFQTDAEADIWMENIRKQVLGKAIDNILLEPPKDFEFNNDFVRVCKSIGMPPEKVCNFLQIQFVEQYMFMNNIFADK